ncbi:MAG: peroxiredoxin [Acidimicrobiales bacterium]|nr:peroxiredoxin [Acidimicrobiales bacterium]
MAVSAGDPAPPFTLPGVLGGVRAEYSVPDPAGRVVVLAFYPGDDTPVCTRQLRSYNEDIDQFIELDALLLGLSPQDLDSHAAFSQNQGGFAFPLLYDEGKQVAAAYGVLGPLGFYRRSVYVIDGAGTVTYAHRGFAGATFRRSPELVDAVRAAAARP